MGKVVLGGCCGDRTELVHTGCTPGHVVWEQVVQPA